MKKVTLIILLLAAQLLGFAQGTRFSSENWYLKPYLNGAAIIQHRSSMGDLIKGYPITYEFNIVKPTTGCKLWQLENNKPDIGMNLSVIDYGNREELGFGVVVAPFVEIPLNKNEHVRRLHLRLCWGVAYMTKHFHLHQNQKNGAIGSGFNAYVQFKWFWKIPVNQNMDLEPGFMFSHVSNGRAQSPNLGLNVFGIGLACNFKLSNKIDQPTDKIDNSTAAKSKHEITIFNSYGLNDGTIMGPKYLTSCLAFGYNYNKRNTHKFGLGFDIFYEENYVKDLKNAGIVDASIAQKARYGPKICYSYNIGCVNLPLEIGTYINQAINPDAQIFSRIGVRYMGKKGLIAGFGLRTHFAVAYNFDLGIGYRIPL